MGTEFCKDHTFYTYSNNKGSIFSLADRVRHRERQKVLSPRVSNQAAEAGTQWALTKLEQILYYMTEQTRLGNLCNVTDLFRAYTVCFDNPELSGAT
jgi:hypothetical protein